MLHWHPKINLDNLKKKGARLPVKDPMVDFMSEDKPSQDVKRTVCTSVRQDYVKV